jgi:predicted dithiol-disulfide oxidoreductase (DUF899 family)
MKMATQTITRNPKHAVVSPAEWLAARKELLRKEKELTRLRDEISRERLELPWEEVKKEYVFNGPKGKRTLAELFDGRDQLIVYHFMFGPEWAEGCPSCSFIADHFDGAAVHLANRGITLTAVSRAPFEKIEPFKKRMGWRFNWVSSDGNDFNWDYHVSFTKEEITGVKMPYKYGTSSFPSDEAPGLSVFYKDEAGKVFHTYSTYARGGDILIGAYNFLDIAPLGRNEERFDWPMQWVRHHDKYPDPYFADAPKPKGAIEQAKDSCCSGEQQA